MNQYVQDLHILRRNADAVCHCERNAAICFLLTTISKLETVRQESDPRRKDILTRVAVHLIEGRT